MFEACANGASIAGKTAAIIVINYIAIISLLAWLNATLNWLGGRVGYPEFSFEGICSYLFWPVAWVMGVDVDDCDEVGTLIGIKLFTTEILAYQELGTMVRSETISVRNSFIFYFNLCDVAVTSHHSLLQARSSTIATYALCGFSSLSSVAVSVGVWRSLCPEKLKDMTRMIGRALFNANVSCFVTACIAGTL